MEVEMNHEPEQTLFWCHECDMSVSIRLVPPPPTTTTMTPLLCPHCFSDLLELMDSTTHYYATSAADDDHDQPQLAAISQVIPDISIHQVTASNISPSPSLLPASKAYVDSIPTVKIPSPSQSSSCNWVCAVCKCDQDQDEDEEEVQVKQLPCNHIYHSHCILPWLSSRSSCPLCRFQLPTDVDTPSCTNSSAAAADSQLMQRLTHLRLQLRHLNTTTNRVRNLWYTNPLILDTTAPHSSFNGSLQ